MRTSALVVGVMVLSGLCLTTWFYLREEPFRVERDEPRKGNTSPGNHLSSTLPNPEPKKEVVLMAVARTAEALNSPETNVESDFATLETILREYRRQYQGNPSGENVEIAAALMGDNTRSLRFVPKLDENQINAQGELIDRWGTPYFFHVESSTKMEIRSAGQDGRFYTEDDVISSPVAGE